MLRFALLVSLTIKKRSVNVGDHGSDITCAVLLLDLLDILLARLIKVLEVTLVHGVDLATRRELDL